MKITTSRRCVIRSALCVLIIEAILTVATRALFVNQDFAPTKTKATTTSSSINNGQPPDRIKTQIERPTNDSRRIRCKILVPADFEDVWAILTDYDRLDHYIPNLIESRRLLQEEALHLSGGGSSCHNNDNANCIETTQQHKRRGGNNMRRCRLYQRGLHKFGGLTLGASVTLDMTEVIIRGSTNSHRRKEEHHSKHEGDPKERKIQFKCVNSKVFSSFDGEWHVKENYCPNSPVGGKRQIALSHDVHVKPKVPLPIAALERRLQDDFSRNVNAIRKAAMEIGHQGVLALRNDYDTAGAASAFSFNRHRHNSNSSRKPVIYDNEKLKNQI